ncbi:MAG: glycosyltransferase [bacterium]
MDAKSNNRIDVVHLIGFLAAGGAERNLYYLAPHLAKSKFRYAIVCLFTKGEFAPIVESTGVPVFELRYRQRFTIQTIIRLTRFLRRNKVKILHAHLFHAAFIGRIAAWLAGTPIIIDHSRGLYPPKRWYHRFFERLAIIIRTDLRLSVSNEIANDMVENEWTPRSKIRIVTSGVDPDHFQVPEDIRCSTRKALGLEGCIVIGTIGRLIEAKGFDLLIEVASLLREQDNRIKFLLIGYGPLEDSLRSEILRRNLSDCIYMLGKRTDIPALLSAMDIYLTTSRSEGVPVTLFEAMAAGKPIVATSVGGIPDVIEDGKDGILVPSRDPEAIARAIMRLLNDKALAESLVANARKKFLENYSTQAVLSKMENIYAELIEKKGIKMNKFT